MPSDLEALIREVLTEQAGRAPHRATVLAGLRWGAHRRRYRRLTMAAAGVAAVLVAVGVPLGLHLTAAPAPTAHPVLVTRPPDVPLTFRVTWLPAGYVATARSAQPHEHLSQRWEPAAGSSSGPAGLAPYVEFDTLAGQGQVAGPSGTQPVDVDGTPGGLSTSGGGAGSPGTAAVTWRTSGTTFEVSAVNLPDSADVALHVARSVTPDHGDVIGQPLWFGALPSAGYETDDLRIRGTAPGDWLAERLATKIDGPTFVATWTATRPHFDHAVSVTVRGGVGWYGEPAATSPNQQGVAVQIGQRWLLVTVSATAAMRDTLIGIVNGMSVEPDATMPWLGR